MRAILLSALLTSAVVAADPPLSTAQPAPTPATQIVLRFDGIYQSEKTKDYYQYLRFFDDGTVIAVSSSATPEQVAKWFDRTHALVSRGTFIISGTRITFAAESKAGVVDYDGRLEGEQIKFRTYAHSNQNAGTPKYKFVKIDKPAE